MPRLGIGVALTLLVAFAFAFTWADSRRSPLDRAGDLATRPGVPSAEGMAWIPGGKFQRGSEEGPDAQPVREIEVEGFWMDRTEVTNSEFAAFVRATGYVTLAERSPDPRLYPGADPGQLVAGSIVFTPPAGDVDLGRPLSWWSYVPGADWRHPEGPGSTVEGREDHPVVQVCWDDAVAYARWAGKRLPTEAEWEYAARGGLERARYTWGNELRPGARWQANIWQGRFPIENSEGDGFRATAPVASFPPNGFGLHDMAGNAWEWCSDWYRPDAYATGPSKDPAGPDSGYDPEEPGVPKRVQRGGSFLCSDQYCVRYLPGARGKGDPGSAASHTGFRCVRPGAGPVGSATPVVGGPAGGPDRRRPPAGCCVPPVPAPVLRSGPVAARVG